MNKPVYGLVLGGVLGIFDGLSALFCVNIGHGRHDVAQAGADQAKELGFFTNWSYAHPRSIELATRIARALGVRLEVVVPPSNDQLIPWLQEGKGDFIAASYTANDSRLREVDFTAPYLFVDPMLVGKRGAKNLPRTLAELKGREVHVRKGSSYFARLTELQAHYGPFTITAVPEDQETEDLLRERPGATVIADYGHNTDAMRALAALADERRWQGPVVVVVAIVLAVALVGHCVRRFGGITGDVLGAACETATLAVLAVTALAAPRGRVHDLLLGRLVHGEQAHGGLQLLAGTTMALGMPFATRRVPSIGSTAMSTFGVSAQPTANNRTNPHSVE